MNRLWVRLSLFFSLFILIGVIMFALLPRIILETNALGFQAQIRDRIAENLSELYQEKGSWKDVGDVLRSYEMITPRGFGTDFSAILFADADGRILYDGTGQHNQTSLNTDEQVAAVPVKVNEIVRGYLLQEKINFTPPFGSDPNFLLRNLLNAFVLFALTIGGLGLVAGILISRQLTSPLSDLAQTVRTFRTPNLNKHAAVKGTVEVREVATAFNEMVEALAEAERLRRNLVGDVAHELRTPLTVLQANIQAILDDLYPLNKTEIENLQTQTDLLQRLVNDLHQLAQAEAHQLQLHMMLVNMNELIQSLVDHFDAIVKMKGMTLKTYLPLEPTKVSVDPDRFAQILQNLIQNAINHTPEDGTITVALSTTVTNVVMSVSDTGAGISEEDQKRIFERFYRTDETRSRQTGGAGLGLPIVKAIVEMHKGTISVKSAGMVNQGTTFTVIIPK